MPPGLLPEAIYWDTNNPYHYFRVDPKDFYDKYFFGGEDEHREKLEHPDEQIRRLKGYITELLSPTSFRVVNQWSGYIMDTIDGLPYIGKLPNSSRQIIGSGFSGNGMTFSTITAMMARDIIQNRHNPWAEIYKPDRNLLKVLVGKLSQYNT